MFGIKTRIKKGWKAFKYATHNLNTSHTPDLDSLLLCHALEKGMGTQYVKHGFGQEKATKLSEMLTGMWKSGNTHSFAFQESLAILKAYIKFQNEDGIELPEIEKRVSELTKSFDNSCNGGYYIGGVQSSLSVLI